MPLLNLTPHAIKLRFGDAERVIPPSGVIARLEQRELDAEPIDGVPTVRATMGVVQNLPESVPGVFLVVSMPVRQELPNRSDLLSPGGTIRDAAGNPVACSYLIRS